MDKNNSEKQNRFLGSWRGVASQAVLPRLVIIIISIVTTLACVGSNASQEAASIASRTITDTTLPLHELWRKGSLKLFSFDNLIVSSKEYVSFFGYSKENEQSQTYLQVLNAANGEVHWRIAESGSLWAIATDESRLFLAADSNIMAYDLASGQQLWDTTVRFKSAQIRPQGERIMVYFTEDTLNRRTQVLYQYVSQNGTLASTTRMDVSSGETLDLRSLSIDYWSNGTQFWAEDRESGRIYWRIDINSPIEDWLVVTDSVVIYASGLYPQLCAVDITTGNSEWVYAKPLVSNFVLSQGILYAIRVDGALVAIDPLTGKEIGYVQFAPTKTEEGTRSTAYWVTASGKRVFVYFGDSQELIALEP